MKKPSFKPNPNFYSTEEKLAFWRVEMTKATKRVNFIFDRIDTLERELELQYQTGKLPRKKPKAA